MYKLHFGKQILHETEFENYYNVKLICNRPTFNRPTLSACELHMHLRKQL